MYRPDGFNNPNRRYDSQGKENMGWQKFEAGADAILVAQRESGVYGTFYSNEAGEVCSEEGEQMYIPCGEGRVKGTVVFIPEEVKNGKTQE